ncbi:MULTISPECIES: hypothetical protein [unclassified Sphingobium]|uniref:hypothetical protein n=1 Tax=unclassified Sphingobium TaxID=2611147 RepID=UPI0035A62AF0
MKRLLLGAVLAAVCLAAAPHPVQARASWMTQPYPYVLIAQDAEKIFSEFGRNLNVPIQMSKSVRGRIKGPIHGILAEDFLDSVTRRGGLGWYFDGFILHICAESEYVSHILEGRGANRQAIFRQARALGLADDRFDLSASPDGRMIRVSGPPAYVAAIERVVQQMSGRAVPSTSSPAAAGGQSSAQQSFGGAQVRIFRGGVGVEVTSVPDSGR